jgi:Spy/CpxP family protein refolding chaperone
LYKERLKKKVKLEVSMKKWHVGMMAALFVALATTLFAFGPGGGGPGFGGGQGSWGGPGAMGQGFGGHSFLANLNLSKEQMEKMWQLKEKFHNETQPLRYQMFQKRFELRKLFSDPTADEATLAAKQKELSGLRLQLQDKMAQMRLEGRKILTPEQIKKLGEAPMGQGFGGRGYGNRSFGGRGPGSAGRGYDGCCR